MEDSSILGGGAKDTRSDARLNVVGNMKDGEMCSAEPDGPPDGFQFVLPFFDLPSRLNVERVSKPLRRALKDPLVWVDLRMGGHACRKLTNEILLKLVARADGHLKSLFLVEALEITDETLSKIFELNPGLERISVPGCRRLKVENFVSLVEAHSQRARVKGLPGISQVRVGGLCNISPEHLLRLENALKISGLPQKEVSRSCLYYGNLEGDNGATDKRPVDVELCPDCKKVGLIYDCTSYKHRMEEGGCSDDISNEGEDYDSWGDECRGRYCRSCISCTPRCDECGTCLKPDPFEEDCSLCSHSLCIDCRNDDVPQCNECQRYACSRHEEDYYFPHGSDGLCCVCIKEDETFLQAWPDTMEISHEFDFDYRDYYCLR